MKTIIGVPGLWEDRSAFIQSLAKEKMVFSGNILHDINAKTSYTAELYPHDPCLAEAFFNAGQGRIKEAEKNQIAQHTFTLYITFEYDQMMELKTVMHIVTKVLNAGGIAVKIETAGLAHRKEDWVHLSKEPDEVSLYYAFVTSVVEQNYFYSCGMHQFGERDVLIYDQWNPELMGEFLLYTMIEKPKLQVGEVFCLRPDAPGYEIGERVCDFYHKDELFYNPFGYWTLSRK